MDMLHDHARLLIHDERCRLDDELLRIRPEGGKAIGRDASQDGRSGRARDTRLVGYLTYQVIRHVGNGGAVDLEHGACGTAKTLGGLKLLARGLGALRALLKAVARRGDIQVSIGVLDSLATQLIAVKLHGIGMLVVDARPQLLELLLVEVVIQLVAGHLCIEAVLDLDARVLGAPGDALDLIQGTRRDARGYPRPAHRAAPPRGKSP